MDPLRLAPRKSIAARSLQPLSTGVVVGGDIRAPMVLIAMSAPEVLMLTMDRSTVIVALAEATQAEPSSAWVPTSLVEQSEERQAEGDSSTAWSPGVAPPATALWGKGTPDWVSERGHARGASRGRSGREGTPTGSAGLSCHRRRCHRQGAASNGVGADRWRPGVPDLREVGQALP